MIYLDTSYLVRGLVPGTACDKQIRSWLAEQTDLAMNSVAWGEFLCGPLDPALAVLARELLVRISEFGEADGALAASLFNETGRRRGSFQDCMIAATTIRNGGSLATLNHADFDRLRGMGLELIG